MVQEPSEEERVFCCWWKSVKERVMDVTSGDGRWRLTWGQIENRETGEVRQLRNAPSAHAVSCMDYDRFLLKCEVAFRTGVWPRTFWSSGRVSD